MSLCKYRTEISGELFNYRSYWNKNKFYLERIYGVDGKLVKCDFFSLSSFHEIIHKMDGQQNDSGLDCD